jgi:hypothetical protein
LKLLTTVPPRSNDTVIHTEYKNGKPDKSIVFTRDADSGELVADVDEALVGKMLLTDNFEPLNEEDHQRAEELMAAAQPKKKRRMVEMTDDDDDETIVVNGGLPIEAHTPPAPPKKSPQSRMGRSSAGRRMSLGA